MWWISYALLTEVISNGNCWHFYSIQSVWLGNKDKDTLPHTHTHTPTYSRPIHTNTFKNLPLPLRHTHLGYKCACMATLYNGKALSVMWMSIVLFCWRYSTYDCNRPGVFTQLKTSGFWAPQVYLIGNDTQIILWRWKRYP